MYIQKINGKAAHSLDAVHPFVLLLGGRGRDTVEGVVALHHASVRLRLTGLDHLVLVVGDEELKAVLQRGDTLGVRTGARPLGGDRGLDYH